jgi:hypothetical protein
MRLLSALPMTTTITIPAMRSILPLVSGPPIKSAPSAKAKQSGLTMESDNSVMMPDFVTNCTTEFDRWSWRKLTRPRQFAPAPRARPGFAASAAAHTMRGNCRGIIAKARANASAASAKRKRPRARVMALSNARISHDEFDLGNVMAQECGYRDLADFMWREEVVRVNPRLSECCEMRLTTVVAVVRSGWLMTSVLMLPALT